MNERDEILQRWRNTINELRSDWTKWEKHTLKEYILQCAELVALQIEYKILEIPLSGISSFLFKELNKEGIEVSDSYLQRVLPDEYKRNYFKSEQCSDLAKFEKIIETEEEIIEKDQFGNYRINGNLVRFVKEKESSQPIQQNKERIEDEITRILRVNARCGELVERIYLALYNKYFENEKTKQEIKNHYKNYNLEESLKICATLQNSKTLLDDRVAWGDYEKIIMNFLIKTGETTAHLATAVGYCSKYGSIGIDRNPDTDFVNNEELKKFLRACPVCRADIADVLNRELKLYQLGKELQIQVPTIKI